MQNHYNSEVLSRQLKSLSFRNPGPLMMNNTGESRLDVLTNREMRKVTRRMYKERGTPEKDLLSKNNNALKLNKYKNSPTISLNACTYVGAQRSRRNQQYDEEGRTLLGRQDLCDCLQEACPGCHYPCPRCGSGKCGGECRCGRCWVYGEVEVEGTRAKRIFENYAPAIVRSERATNR